MMKEDDEDENDENDDNNVCGGSSEVVNNNRNNNNKKYNDINHRTSSVLCFVITSAYHSSYISIIISSTHVPISPIKCNTFHSTL